MITFRDKFRAGFGPRSYCAGEWGKRFCIETLGGLWDADDECASLTLMGSHILSRHCLSDALTRIGESRRLTKYPGETWEQYRTRLWAAWDDYRVAGSGVGLLRQLTYWGIPDDNLALWLDPPGDTRAVHGASSWWSQFWIYCDGGPDWGTFGPAPTCGGSGSTCGEMRCGISGATEADLRSIRDLVLQWKPDDHACRAVIFDFGGGLTGTLAIQPFTGTL